MDSYDVKTGTASLARRPDSAAASATRHSHCLRARQPRRDRETVSCVLRGFGAERERRLAPSLKISLVELFRHQGSREA